MDLNIQLKLKMLFRLCFFLLAIIFLSCQIDSGSSKNKADESSDESTVVVTTAVSTYSSSLQGIEYTVIDSITKDVIMDANVYTMDGTWVAVTDSNGKFVLKCNDIYDAPRFTVEKTGYEFSTLIRSGNIIEKYPILYEALGEYVCYKKEAPYEDDNYDIDDKFTITENEGLITVDRVGQFRNLNLKPVHLYETNDGFAFSQMFVSEAETIEESINQIKYADPDTFILVQYMVNIQYSFFDYYGTDGDVIRQYGGTYYYSKKPITQEQKTTLTINGQDIDGINLYIFGYATHTVYSLKSDEWWLEFVLKKDSVEFGDVNNKVIYLSKSEPNTYTELGSKSLYINDKELESWTVNKSSTGAYSVNGSITIEGYNNGFIENCRVSVIFY